MTAIKHLKLQTDCNLHLCYWSQHSEPRYLACYVLGMKRHQFNVSFLQPDVIQFAVLFIYKAISLQHTEVEVCDVPDGNDRPQSRNFK